MDKLNVEAWVGREAVSQGHVSQFRAAEIHATLGEGDQPEHGAPLPPLWHWCAFPTTARTDQLGRDGHAKGSRLLPRVHLSRRMWAGGALSFHRCVRVGEIIEKRSRVRSVTEKMGRSGAMVFVSIDHEIHGEMGLAIEERQDIVYLDIPESFTPPKKRPMGADAHEEVETQSTLLFRYSALTFNAHRIHYDLPYTQEVEKYPGLLVHGPLQATLLMRAAVRHKNRVPHFFDFRGVHPMFSGEPCQIAMKEQDDCLVLWAGQDGHQCMQASAVWEETQ